MSDWKEEVTKAIGKAVGGNKRGRDRLLALIGEYIERSGKQAQAIQLLVKRHNAAQAAIQHLNRRVEQWESWYKAHRMVRLIAKPPKAEEVGGTNAQSSHVVSLGSPVISGAMVSRDAGKQGGAPAG